MKVCPNCHTEAQFETQAFCAVCGYHFPAQAAQLAPAPEPRQPAAQCPHCGAPLNTPNARFCGVCGQAIAAASAQTPAAPAPAAQPAQNPPAAQAKRRGLPLPAIIGLAVGAAALVIAAVVLVLHFTRKPDSADLAPEAVSSAAEQLPESAAEAPAVPTSTDAPAATAAMPSDTQVVLRNAAANGTITVDGTPVEFSYVGNDAVIARELLPDVCQVRIVAAAEGGGLQTAAVWYNKDYGNELTFGNDYGAYAACSDNGLAAPGDKLVEVLTWAYYRSYLTAINAADPNQLQYTTDANLQRCSSDIITYSVNSYDVGNFQAVIDPTSIVYTGDGTVTYNAGFTSYRTNADGVTETRQNYRTIRLKWQDGIWKVDAYILLEESAYNAHTYAALP